ncbi:DNA-binding protein [Mesorhizobium sp.]|nr:DNA-binding protein [Mesorhizobium sp.]RWP30576.1 MAG: DNA-binding protein [Mesorhizobium sp.]RWQ53713.1 MAG: DNA-binding protein [Mesorhizobium sp.]
MTLPTENPATLDMIWGARAIGALINRNPRVTFALLETNQIPGAKKIGGRWCVSLHKLRETFGLTEAA